MNNEEISKIRDLLTKGNTTKAINELKVFYKPFSFQRWRITRIETRFNNLQKSNLRGIIDYNQYTIHTNKINDSILDFLENLESNENTITNQTLLKRLSAISTVAVLIVLLISPSKKPNYKQATEEKVQDSVDTIFFNTQGRDTSELIELRIVLKSKKVDHKFFVLKTMKVENLKDAVVSHYGIHDILKKRKENYDELVLAADNVKLTNESLSLEEAKVKSGDAVKIIPVAYLPPALITIPESIPSIRSLVEIRIINECRSPVEFSYIRINNAKLPIHNSQRNDYRVTIKANLGHNRLYIPQIGFMREFNVYEGMNHLIIRYCHGRIYSVDTH